MMFHALLFAAAVLAGSIAAVSGFGIGSVLTPLLASQMDTRLAVAVVSLPHLLATAVRFISLRDKLDVKVFMHFGVLSAIGGLLGALLNVRVGGNSLALVFACLLLFAGILGLTGLTAKMRFSRALAWLAGAGSGFFGGLVGNQGGIRSAALLGFGLSREALVATATATALVIDGVRIPIYLAAQWRDVVSMQAYVGIALAGVLTGTLLGVRALRKMSEQAFRTGLSCLITLLGVYMLMKGVGVAR